MKRRGNFQRIADDKARRLTSKKRKAGLFKKLQELSILCDVKACVVLYDPDNHPQPEAWPNPHEAAAILHRFLALPGYRRTQRRFDLLGSLRLQANKMMKSLDKQLKALGRLPLELLFSDCLGGSPHDLEDLSLEVTAALALLAEIKLTEIDAKISALRSRRMAFRSRNRYFSSFMAAPPPPTLSAVDFRCKEEFCPAEEEGRRAGLLQNEMGSSSRTNHVGEECDFRRFSLMNP